VCVSGEASGEGEHWVGEEVTSGEGGERGELSCVGGVGGARVLRGLSVHLQRVAPREERRILRREATYDGVHARPEPRRADGRACRVVGTR
jgi:hypothetical protein